MTNIVYGGTVCRHFFAIYKNSLRGGGGAIGSTVVIARVNENGHLMVCGLCRVLSLHRVSREGLHS